jgi:excisionase family DNA binding protein
MLPFERKPYYSPSELAVITSQHPSTILRYIHEGKLPAVKLSERAYRIPLGAVLAWLAPDELSPVTRVTLPAGSAGRALDELEAETGELVGA